MDILKSLGMEPDGMVGHSVGELACGYADGCLTRKETILAAYERGQSIKTTQTPKGAMAATGKAYKRGSGCYG